MAIYEVTDTEVRQRCEACHQERRVLLKTLKVGIPAPPTAQAEPSKATPNILQMPPCTGCGAVEFLIRTPSSESEHPSQGSFSHLHHLLIGHLHAELATRNQVHPSLIDAEGKAPAALTRSISAAMRAQWFPDGFRIPERPTEPT